VEEEPVTRPDINRDLIPFSIERSRRAPPKSINLAAFTVAPEDGIVAAFAGCMIISVFCLFCRGTENGAASAPLSDLGQLHGARNVAANCTSQDRETTYDLHPAMKIKFCRTNTTTRKSKSRSKKEAQNWPSDLC
jgi:hypothetical protein